MKQLTWSDFSPALRWATTIAFTILTSGFVGLIWQASAKNSEFNQMKIELLQTQVDIVEAERKVIIQEKKNLILEALIIDIAVNVCEIKSRATGEPIAPCQQIRQSFSK